MPRKNIENDNLIKMIMNNVFHSYSKNGTEVLSHLLEIGFNDLHFMSEDAIKNWILEALSIADEILTWKKDNVLKKRITIYRKSLDFCNTRERLISLFVNIYLSCNGLSTLSGYGMATTTVRKGRMKSRGRIMLNPEKRSIY